MRRISVVSVALASVVVLCGPVSSAASPGVRGDLPREVTRGVVVALPDGDRYRVTHAADHRTVWGRRFDGATGTWLPRTVLLRKRDLHCGDVDARSANGAVAVTAHCDRGGWPEDQAPTASHALHSTDLVTWRSHQLPGEAHEEPGISPDGTRAVWPLHQAITLLDPESGFADVGLRMPGQEYSVTAVVDDSGAASVLYGGVGQGESCAIGVAHRSPTGTVTEQRVDGVPHACSDVGLVNVDAHTVLFGDAAEPAWQTTIGRSNSTGPWSVTRVAPAAAPGLEAYSGRGHFGPVFLTADDLSVAVGSSDGREIRAQSYDDAAQAWRPGLLVDRTPRRCRGSNPWLAQPYGVAVLEMPCRGADRVVITTDGNTWHSLRLGRRPLGISPDGRFVAVPGRSGTTVFSRERGAVRLPGGVSERCDVVVPIAADAALRLTAKGRAGGFPRVLQQSTRSGWRRIGSLAARPRGTCERVHADTWSQPYAYSVVGPEDSRTVRFVRGEDGWQVRTTRAR